MAAPAAPAVGGLLVGPIVQYIAHEVRGSGVPEVMESVAIRGGAIRPRVIISKILAATITIGSGGSAGREGPIIHIGSAIGSAVGQLLAVSARRLRTFVACGAAAGIAATFNAPIAGALFAVEVIIGDFGVTQFSPIVISAVVATVISRHFIGDFPAFEVPAFKVVSAFEFLPYAVLGILAGLLAVLFIITLYRTTDWFDQLKIPAVLKPAGRRVGCGNYRAGVSANLRRRLRID
ncbi:MAG: chloride channel protein [Calditrichia bacterium]